MITILKTQREVLPAAKLIGKRYTDADRDDSGGFGVQWGQWFANHWFEPLLGADLAGNCSDPVGAMRCTAGLLYTSAAPRARVATAMSTGS